MNARKLSSLRRALGQGMTEYIIIVALIAVSAIGVYSLFGQTIRNQTAGLAQEIAGAKDGGKDAQDAAISSGAAAQSAANAKKGMGNYHTGQNRE